MLLENLKSSLRRSWVWPQLWSHGRPFWLILSPPLHPVLKPPLEYLLSELLFYHRRGVKVLIPRRLF